MQLCRALEYLGELFAREAIVLQYDLANGLLIKMAERICQAFAVPVTHAVVAQAEHSIDDLVQDGQGTIVRVQAPQNVVLMRILCDL